MCNFFMDAKKLFLPPGDEVATVAVSLRGVCQVNDGQGCDAACTKGSMHSPSEGRNQVPEGASKNAKVADENVGS
jgi:hypothetical protein